ncbi:NFAT activation molecule 1 isoform X2 [Anolis sagrei]|uniref:NFAT activation molecule 1 isoform X2 n=1 Tax=Anolis sagrei TaxID=38937 RepID=UPI00295C38A7|nr:NFAT activation molecule 1 isoform X2 [Anolis sagrei ordinatus]
MPSHLYIVILLLWTVQCAEHLSLQDTSLIQIAFINEPVDVTCRATTMCKSPQSNLEIWYNQTDESGREKTVYKNSSISLKCTVNQTWAKSFNVHIMPANHGSVTGFYACKAKLNSETSKGSGTFIRFRDKGYIEPFPTTWVCLITVTVILAALSIGGTALLFWKREVVWPEKNRVKKCPNKKSTPQHTSGSLGPPESMYTDLEPHQPDVYLDFEKKLSSPLHTAMPTTKVIKGEIQDVYENNSIDVYENI